MKSILLIAILSLFSPGGAQAQSICTNMGSTLSRVFQDPTQVALDQWHEIELMPDGFRKIAKQQEFFDRWAKIDPITLKKMARNYFDQLMSFKHENKSAYLTRLQNQTLIHGSALSQEIQNLKDSGMNFEQALSAVSRGSVETVLTAHPTQIQSALYRQLWQVREGLKKVQKLAKVSSDPLAFETARSVYRLVESFGEKGFISEPTEATNLSLWTEKWLPTIDQKILHTEPGSPTKLTVDQEAKDSVDVYLNNIYEAHSELRKHLIDSMKKTFGASPGYDPSKVEKAADRTFSLSSWAWDADGKSNVTAKSMAVSDAIQQSGVYRLHELKLDEILQTTKDPEIKEQLENFRSALTEHAKALRSNPQSTAVITDHPEIKFPVDPELLHSPSQLVRSFFTHWMSSIVNKLGASKLRSFLEDLSSEIKTFYVSNQIRQNSAVIQKAETDAAIFQTEMDRLKVLAKDPGPNSAYISADTKNLDDTDKTLTLINKAGLTGKVRYFPLVENMETFRQSTTLVEQWLHPGALMRQQILARSAYDGKAPTLHIMFALSDTSRLGSQAAPHLMEIKAEEIKTAVAEMFKKYPVTPEEIAELKTSRAHLQNISSPFNADIFWGGGSQLARGGDWLSDDRMIYTDQGNARDLKYDSPEMALYRMDRHLASGIRQSVEKSTGHPSETDLEKAKLLRLTSERETKYGDLFFEKTGHRDAVEAYLLFGSMLTETRSNSYGARAVSRVDDLGGANPKAVHRLQDRIFTNPEGKSFEQIVQQKGLKGVLNMRLKDFWHEMRPGVPYAPPTIDQRAITIDNTFSETKINQLAESVDAENALGIDAETSARWLARNETYFQSYQRQKMAEVIAASMANLNSHLSRLPEALRPLVNDEKNTEYFLTKTKGKSADELTVEDLVATFSYIHQTIKKVIERNEEVAKAFKKDFPGLENPLSRAQSFARSPSLTAVRSPVDFGESLLGWIHQRSVFGSTDKSPQGLSSLFSGLYSEPGKTVVNDELGQLEYLAWALHYEGQQLPLEVNTLNPAHFR